METGEIQDSLNEISNADAEKIIKEAKKESKGDPDRVPPRCYSTNTYSYKS